MKKTTGFGSEFNKELLKSEQLRVAVLIGVLFIGLLQALIILTFFPEFIDKVFKDPSSFKYIIVWLLSFMLFETLIFFRIKRARALERSIPTPMKYVNVFTEIAFPTIMLYILVIHGGSDFLLDGPIGLVYFIIIILAALHLDFKLCAFGGLLAGMEFLALSF